MSSNLAFAGVAQLVRLQGRRWYDCMDAGGRTLPGASVESAAGSERREHLLNGVGGSPAKYRQISELSQDC
jgi:hypothetical protein